MKEVCADTGYASEENYEFMERFGISAYVVYLNHKIKFFFLHFIFYQQ